MYIHNAGSYREETIEENARYNTGSFRNKTYILATCSYVDYVGLSTEGAQSSRKKTMSLHVCDLSIVDHRYMYCCRGGDLSLLGPEGLVLLAGPVVFGLGHAVPFRDGLEPGLVGVGTALYVELGVVEELAGLGDVALVVGLLLGRGLLADLVVLIGGEARGDVGAASVDGALFEVLAAACAIVVLVGLGGEQVHVENASGDGLAALGSLLDGGQGRRPSCHQRDQRPR